MRSRLLPSLVLLRDLNGWGFDHLAKRLRVSEREVRRWFKGEASPLPKHRQRIRRFISNHFI